MLSNCGGCHKICLVSLAFPNPMPEAGFSRSVLFRRFWGLHGWLGGYETSWREDHQLIRLFWVLVAFCEKEKFHQILLISQGFLCHAVHYSFAVTVSFFTDAIKRKFAENRCFQESFLLLRKRIIFCLILQGIRTGHDGELVLLTDCIYLKFNY